MAKIFGFFSEKQRVVAGSVWYRCPVTPPTTQSVTNHGGIIEVTQIDENPNYHKLSKWDDMIPLGEVMDLMGKCRDKTHE